MKFYTLIILFVVMFTMACPAPIEEITEISLPKIIEAKNFALTNGGSDVHIIWASGRKKNDEVMTDPLMTDTFEFFTSALEPSGWPMKSWLLTYENQWAISAVDMPLGIQVDLDLANVEMDVCDAWRLVKSNNLASSFYNWRLHKALNPTIKHPSYGFQITSTKFIVVDAVTAEITSENSGQPIPQVQ